MVTLVVLRKVHTSDYSIKKALPDGVSSFEVQHTEQAHEYLREHIKTSVVLVDVYDTELIDFIKCVQSYAKGDVLPILAIVKNPYEKFLEHVLSYAIYDVFTEPFKEILLIHRIRRILLEKQQEILLKQLVTEDDTLKNKLSSTVFELRKSLFDASINEERFKIALSHISDIMFDNILEADISRDMLLGKNSERLTTLLGISNKSSYTRTIQAISEKLTYPDFAEEYRDTLSVETIKSLFEQGQKTMQYECIERSDGSTYRWIRIHYCIYLSEITNTLRIISYVKNMNPPNVQSPQG